MSSHRELDHHAPEHPCCGISTNVEDYFLTRRQFLNRMGMGLGGLALANLLDPRDLLSAQPGSIRISKPSMGSWLVYGLGTENQNLPGFIALRGGRLPPGGVANYQSAFLPGVYQGASINTSAPSVPQMIQNIRNTYVGPHEQR